MNVLQDILTPVIQGRVLCEDTASAALLNLLAGDVPAAQISAFLAAVQMRGISLAELRGFHRALADSGTRVHLGENELIDVCGTGGDGKGTFNISTLTAFVLAGAGVKVAKHGNSSATSGCGSSDILAHLGVEFSADETTLRRNLKDANMCYLHAPLFQPALKAVAPVRREIGFRTFFNLLGPLVNPARPRFQFIGVAEPSVLRLYRYFFEDGETEFALVHSRDGYDEISLTGAFDLVTNEGAETFYPDELGYATIDAEELRSGKDVESAAGSFLEILRNGREDSPLGQVVIANATFAMNLAQPQLGLAECRLWAEESLRSGAAFRAFEILRGE